jgi:hypothetical protein
MAQTFPKHDIVDDNPAIKLYGNRFFKDQTEIELLSEFLLVFVSPKTIGSITEHWSEAFPNANALQDLADGKILSYHPKTRLILKLFAFLSSSKLETRHECHAEKFRSITEELKNRIESSGENKTDETLRLLEQVLVGYVGVAQNRTWCTHSFLPISSNLIARETIWSPSKAKNPNLRWDEAIELNAFQYSKHDFMARGGELLFLQMLNLFLRVNSTEVQKFIKDIGHGYNPNISLQHEIQENLQSFLGTMPYLSELADWIESADPDNTGDKKAGKSSCNWVPTATWKEAYLFAYEFLNILKATMDPLEKLELLKLSAVLQVLRTLCAQAARVRFNGLDRCAGLIGPLGFVWLVTAPELKEIPLKQAAQSNFRRILELISGAVRKNDELNPTPKGKQKPNRIKDGEEQSIGLFTMLGKKIGLIVPWKGPGTRFTVNEGLLRYLVLSLVPPGQRMTLTTFQTNMFKHYGIAICGDELKRGVNWTYRNLEINPPYGEQQWLEDALKASGFLKPLSDAVSLVHNPFSR